MALDEALLRHATGAWLRCYAWEPAAVSLGYFQTADELSLPVGLPRVRRITGGGAIHHADEITLALVLPSDWLPSHVADAYGLVNGAVAAALAEYGVATRIPAGPREPGGQRAKAHWCFARPTGLDLVLADGRKVFGSAQRRSGGRTLHHGSLVLRAPALTPMVGELPQIAGHQRTELEASLAAALAGALDARLEVREGWPAEILAAAEELVAHRHARPAWIERRG